MKRAILLAALLLPCLVTAQNFAGTWSGVLDVGPAKLRIVFNVTEKEGGYAATMDSPDQGAFGLPVASVTMAGDRVAMKMPALGASYSGQIAGDSIRGQFDQNGASFSLNLVRAALWKPKRPQDPQPPYPYRSEEVTFRNEAAGETFHGTLTIPEGRGKFPAVVMVTGSGLQDRNEEIMGHKPFLVIADFLTRRGIAVLRYDDRGFGESTEALAARKPATTEDYMQDAMCAFRCLSSCKEVDGGKVGIVGHSEGGMIAMMAGARHSEVAFMVSLAGVAVRGDSLMIRQNRDVLMQQGVYPAEYVEAYCEVLRKIYPIIEGYSLDRIKQDYQAIGDTLFNGRATILPEALRQNANKTMQSMAGNAWWRYFLAYDPSADLAKLGGKPLLALNGSKDIQVDADANLAVIERYITLPSAVRKYDGLNHLFQHCRTGALDEYYHIEETVSPEVLKDIADWISKITR